MLGSLIMPEVGGASYLEQLACQIDATAHEARGYMMLVRRLRLGMPFGPRNIRLHRFLRVRRTTESPC